MPTMPFANFPQYPQVPFSSNVSADAWPLPPFMGYAPSSCHILANPFVAAGPSMVPMPMKAPRSPHLPDHPPPTARLQSFASCMTWGEQAEVGLEEVRLSFWR